MKEMNEQQTDLLILKALERRHILEDINKAVMHDVCREARRRKFRYWRNAVAFSFGLPLALFVFGVLLVKYVVMATSGPYAVVCIVFPVATVLFAAWKAVCHFSAGQSVINKHPVGLINEV